MLQSSNVKTDSQGRFVFERLPTGFAYLYAWKEADGYPYVAFSFNLEPSMTLPRIEVKPGETVDGVVIQVGEKPAYLTIETTDEDGKPLNAGIYCYRPDQGDHGDYSRSMHFKETIPVPIVPFSLAMNEKGYEPWHYGQDPGQSKDGLIKLKSGETLTLQVKLKREH